MYQLLIFGIDTRRVLSRVYPPPPFFPLRIASDHRSLRLQNPSKKAAKSPSNQRDYTHLAGLRKTYRRLAEGNEVDREEILQILEGCRELLGDEADAVGAERLVVHVHLEQGLLRLVPGHLSTRQSALNPLLCKIKSNCLNSSRRKAQLGS